MRFISSSLPTHRLPNKLAMLVDEFADYGGLRAAHDVAARRLIIVVPCKVVEKSVGVIFIPQ
jgi:hypothetical protein